MNWFRGSIPAAISSAKLSNGIFIVYIYDKSDLSKHTRETLNKDEISQILSSSSNVAIEIENGTQDAIQFAQIYPLIVVPSLFFISPQTGIPLEVIGGDFEEKSLIEKYKKIAPKENEVPIPESKAETTCPTPKQSSQATDSSSEQLSETKSQKMDSVERPGTSGVSTSLNVEKIDASPIVANANEGASASSPAETTQRAPSETTQRESTALSLEERVERAKELLNEKQEEKNLERIEEEKRNELERRRQSQEVAKAKQRREDQERLEMSKQRKKDKEEDRLARERVKAQIAADRAEREARNALLKGEQPPSASAPLQPPVAAPSARLGNEQNNASITRIKFRFPDNSSAFAQFPPEAALSDVRNHILQECRLPFRNFKMVGALPPQTFTEDQMSLTLTELGLTPSAIIIVKPISEPVSTNLVPSGDGIMSLFWSLLAPLTFLINYVSGLLGFGARRQGPPNADSSDDDDLQTSKRPRTEGSYTTRNRPKTAYGRRGERDAYQRRQGNIHRLNRDENDDDDDENNTWNGNSTQQM